MSRKPIARSADLLRLRNEGYDLDIQAGHLLIRTVPYVDAGARVRRTGMLVMKLDLSGDRTVKPTDHTTWWIGDHPCHSDGQKITAIEHPSAPKQLSESLRADFMFSAKANYRDYHHKVTTYIACISGEASRLMPDATAKTFPPIAEDEPDSVFKYVDTASSRAGIAHINGKVAGSKVGIVGVGGTGAYVLDLVAKTAVAEIHLFDGDVFSQHNAFRSPGAVSLAQLEIQSLKVDHWAAVYAAMRNGIYAHSKFLDDTNLHLLDGLDFVFICLDEGSAKRTIVEHLSATSISFIDVGLGVVITDGRLGGIVRTTTSTTETRDLAAKHIFYGSDNVAANEYATNIQIAELNALNAAQAVIQWKRLAGVYLDLTNDHYSGYSISTGEIVLERKG